MSHSLDHFIEDALREFDGPAEVIAESPGDQIAHYTLIEELGTGGFGIVWRAEQSQPVRRQVALKILKAGMDTREIISRFKAERQTLAVLDHPGIAKVLDAGATPSGRPFLVMELVRGLALTTHAREHALTLETRLRLFIEICRAVQHAHQKGVIHRDLKPSNLLITTVDGHAVPKVIDFGIAKVTSGSEAAEAQSFVTRQGRLIGTPAYMSPEQSMPGMDIDTRTDIYSLGVVLYELLTSQLPFPAKDGTVDRSRDPRRPSTLVGTAQNLAHEVKNAGVAVTTLPADLDWIVLKALEHDRSRRYHSADAFAADIEACLEQKPVSARPPSTWYLLSRFTQRNKLGVSAAAAIVLVLLGGIATTTWMYWEQKKALVRSEQVSRFMKDILAQAGVSKSLGRDSTMMREILDKTAQRIGDELSAYPEVQAELRGVIGRIYEDIDEYEQAATQSAEQLRLRRAIHSGDHADLATAILDHASVMESLGKTKEAEAMAREALAMRQRMLGPNHRLTAEVEGLMTWILVKSGRSAEGESHARVIYDLWLTNREDRLLQNGPRSLAAVYKNTRRVPEAIKIYQDYLSVLKKQHGPEHPDIVICLDNLSHDLVNSGRFDEAEPYLLESIRQGKKFYQDRSPVADHAYASLSRIAAHRQQWDKQLEFAREAFAAAARVFPPGHRYYREGSSTLARTLLSQAERFHQSDPARALKLLDELANNPGLEADRKAMPGWPECLRGAALLKDSSKQDQARQHLTTGLEALKKKLKPTEEDQKHIKQAEAWLSRL